MSGEVFLGLGGTVDFELCWDEQMMQYLVDRLEICSADLKEPRQIITERDLLLSVLYAIKTRSGKELSVSDSHVLIDFAQHFSYQVTLGGTCVRAALALSALGIASKVHLVSISDEVRERLGQEITWVCSAEQDTLDPHVIVQYPAGCMLRLWDGTVLCPTRPNRVILVNDPPNERMMLVPDFEEHCQRAQVILISGFNAMSDHDLLAQRLAQIEHALATCAEDTIVLFEDAGYHDDALRAQVIASTSKWANVFSLNEDEAQYYAQKTIDFGDPQELCDLFKTLRDSLRVPNIVLHTEHYAATAGSDSERIFRAIQSGCQMASTRFAYGDALTKEHFEAAAQAPMDPIGQELSRNCLLAENGIKIAPSYNICTEQPTTIGLGDSFVAGMMLSLS